MQLNYSLSIREMFHHIFAINYFINLINLRIRLYVKNYLIRELLIIKDFNIIFSDIINDRNYIEVFYN